MDEDELYDDTEIDEDAPTDDNEWENDGDDDDFIHEDADIDDPSQVGDDDDLEEEDELDPDDPDPSEGEDDSEDDEEEDISYEDLIIDDEAYLEPTHDEDHLVPEDTSETDPIDGANYTILNKSNPSRSIHSLQIIHDGDDIFSVEVSDETTVSDLSGVNTWNHFRLIPSSRPIINPPEFRSSFIEIPGADGLLDVSGALSDGWPLYGRRKGDIEFYVTRDYGSYHSWTKVYSNIMSYLHGRYVKCILMDDPAFYYRGRITVNQWRSEKDWSKIVLNYDFEPYKYALFSTQDRWLWDPFDFVDGVVTDPINYFGEDKKGFEVELRDFQDFIVTAGDMRFVPKIVVANDCEYDTKITLKLELYHRTKNANGSIKETAVALSDPNLVFSVDKNGMRTVNAYTVSVKNGSYRLRVKYDSSVSTVGDGSLEYDYLVNIRLGLLYRYGSL